MEVPNEYGSVIASCSKEGFAEGREEDCLDSLRERESQREKGTCPSSVTCFVEEPDRVATTCLVLRE